jgi:beta-lactamase superfamily II metal-dependent hydrolase
MLSDPPPANVVEVSVFGPGYGESVVVHLGNKKWLIVDSCLDRANGSVPALDYLNSVGVNAAEDVLLVVGSHAHDDHIAGISKIVSACKTAYFVCSRALTEREFAALVSREIERGDLVRQRVYSEYANIFSTLEGRGRSPIGTSYLKYAIEQRPLIDDDFGDPPLHVKVTSLSPSDEAINRAIRKLADFMLRSGDNRAPRGINPNELSVVLWIEIADKTILLGADLLRGPVGCGWRAVLATHNPKDRRAGVYKIPHHGAPNAHYLPVWNDLLEINPVAILAPWRNGSNVRPDRADRRRIRRLTNRAFTTSPSEARSNAVGVRDAAAAMNGIARNVRAAIEPIGHVRARSEIGIAVWDVAYDAPAGKLYI